MRLVLLAAVLCLASPAAAQATYRDFRSPSGKVGCAFYSDAEVPRSTRFGRPKCISRRRGMTCRSLASGRGFRVSVAKRELF